MGDCVVLTPGRPQPASRNGLLSCLNTSERLYFCERDVSTMVWLVISTRCQRHAHLQSPIAFMISWLPKPESTIPPAASACHLNFSISRYTAIVSSPLFTGQEGSGGYSIGIPIYGVMRTTSCRAQSLPTHNVPCLNEEVDSFGVPIVVGINDTRHPHDL